ncbi:MAG: lytic transglycosylase [Firmicutes bacterium HGW-Firmicutes-14]|nr:MAG: lytic transglycosylase [Firmicutes bacterium HGW-Firmicutes-14]
MTSKKRTNSKLIWWVVFLLILGVIFTNKTFWRYIYPFPHKEIIYAEAARNNIDPYLVAAIIKTESNFSSEAESRSGARGIMQIMPETGAWAARQMNMDGFTPDDLYETGTNIKIGCWYLNNLNSEFKGNKILVIAAYNGGRGNVREWMEKKQWTGEHSDVDRIPFPETREYVKKVLTNYSWYRYLYQK